jgi:hypothetical protein
MQNSQMHAMRTPMQQLPMMAASTPMSHPGLNSGNGPINGNAIYQSYSAAKGMGAPPPPPPPSAGRSNYNNNPVHSTPIPPRDFHNNSNLNQPYPYNNSYDGSLNDSEQVKYI